MVKSLEKLQKEFQKVTPKSFNEWNNNKKRNLKKRKKAEKT